MSNRSAKYLASFRVPNLRDAFGRIRAARMLGNLPCITRKLVISYSPCPSAYCMFTIIVFLCVKCSSIASKLASLPRPEFFTPP
jgi:hypothetical protein